MEITFYGHASLAITTKSGHHLVVDPFISANPNASDVAIDAIKADYILITHAHQDHVLDVEQIAKNTGATIVSNYEIAMHYQEKGYKVHPMNHGGVKDFAFGSLKYVNAVHTSSFADGTYGGEPGGFIVNDTDKNLYIAGDTALHMDMQLIPMQYTIDLAVLPIGDNFTMGVQDAIIASDFVGCNRVLGYHYDTFEVIAIDHAAAKAAFTAKNKSLELLEISQKIVL